MSVSSQEAVNMDKRIERLFLRLAAIYGHMWISIYKTEEFMQCSKREWREGLKSFDSATVGEALELCREHKSYPPSLAKFIEICKSTLKRETYFTKIEETSRSDPVIARMHLANIHAMLIKKT